MDAVKKRNELIANISAAVAFLITYGLCILFGWMQIMGGFFTDTPPGSEFKTPVLYILVCLLFYAVMYTLSIFAIKLKNKVMAILPFCYCIIFILSFVLLGIFSSGGIENETLLNIVEWALVFTLAPSYGIMWQLPLLLFVIIALALLVLSIVSLVKVFKKKR